MPTRPERACAPLCGSLCIGSRTRARYTAFWNFSFITSAAGALNGTCSPAPPLAYESQILNASFEVRQLSPGAGAPAETLTTELPSQPTGIVSAASASWNLVREGAGAASALLALALLSAI
jgi:hypothetical protein